MGLRKAKPILKKACLKCGEEQCVSEVPLPTLNKRAVMYKCGHAFMTPMMEEVKLTDFVSSDGKTPYPYQFESFKFGEHADGRVLFAHEMGLGKTIIALMMLKAHPEMFPVIILCKSKLKHQWFKEIIRWLGLEYVAQIISTSKDKPQPFFKIFIVSMDMLRNVDWVDDLKANTVIIDECQLIKNDNAARTNAVRKVCLGKEYVIALSGTPIKNQAGEFFPILNILKPERFPSAEVFYDTFVDTYKSGRTTRLGGIKRDMLSYWERKTSDFILRFERKDVGHDLPSIARNFRFCDLGEYVNKKYKENYLEKVMEEYEEAHEGFQTAMRDFEAGDDKEGRKFSNVLAYMTRMRHLTGLAKIEPIVDFVADFLIETDRKIVIFVHHKDVANILNLKLTKLCNDGGFQPPLVLHTGLSDDKVTEIDGKFRDFPGYRILIASTLGFSEGHNWQHCTDAIIAERQWNPANEEQAESRFPRIGRDWKAEGITSIAMHYFVATGTIDELFSEIVERKREAVARTLGNREQISWNESSLMRELAEALMKKGAKRWRIA